MGDFSSETAGYRSSPAVINSHEIELAPKLICGPRMTNDVFQTIDSNDLVDCFGGSRLGDARARAQELGLRITSTTGGRHAPGSYHYSGRAFDAAGSHGAMRQFYREMAGTNPTELFYDPMGGIKNGRNIGAIGGHGTHVHIAY